MFRWSHPGAHRGAQVAELKGGEMALVARRALSAGDWLTIAPSDSEEDEEPPPRKRRKR